MELCFKIMMNSFYGSTLTDKTKFKDMKICTSKEQALKLTKNQILILLILLMKI